MKKKCTQYSKPTIATTTVRESIGALDRGAGVTTNNSQGPGFLQRKSIVGILQQDTAGSPDLANNLVMIVLDINMLVGSLVFREESIEVNIRIVSGVLSKEIPPSKDSGGHVVNPRLGDGVVVNIRG